MESNLNGIIIDGKVYEAILPETDSCKGCAFQEGEFGCIKVHCHSFKPTNFGRAKHIFRFSPELTERLNKERMTPHTLIHGDSQSPAERRTV